MVSYLRTTAKMNEKREQRTSKRTFACWRPWRPWRQRVRRLPRQLPERSRMFETWGGPAAMAQAERLGRLYGNLEACLAAGGVDWELQTMRWYEMGDVHGERVSSRRRRQ